MTPQELTNLLDARKEQNILTAQLWAKMADLAPSDARYQEMEEGIRSIHRKLGVIYEHLGDWVGEHSYEDVYENYPEFRSHVDKQGIPDGLPTDMAAHIYLQLQLDISSAFEYATALSKETGRPIAKEEVLSWLHEEPVTF